MTALAVALAASTVTAFTVALHSHRHPGDPR